MDNKESIQVTKSRTKFEKELLSISRESLLTPSEYKTYIRNYEYSSFTFKAIRTTPPEINGILKQKCEYKTFPSTPKINEDLKQKWQYHILEYLKSNWANQSP